MEVKTECSVCGKTFNMTNPKFGCPYCNEEKKLINKSEKSENNKNSIASIFKVIGWINLVVGFIGGIIIGANQEYCSSYGCYKDFDATLMFIIWFAGACSMFLCYAFAEIISILHDIRAKIK